MKNNAECLKEQFYYLASQDNHIFEFIQAGALDGFWFLNMNNPDQVWFNPNFLNTLGYSAKDVYAKQYSWKDVVIKDDLQTIYDNIVIHQKNTDVKFDVTARFLSKDNAIVWMRLRGIAMCHNHEHCIFMLGGCTDVSASKVAEQKIIKLSNQYETVFNGTQDALFLVAVSDEQKFRYVRTNRVFFEKTGMSNAMLINRSPQEVFGEEMGKKLCQNYMDCVTTKDVIYYEEIVPVPSGKKIWRTTLTPIIEDDVVTFIVGSALDITLQRKLEKKLKTLANYDALTGLENNRLFFENLEQKIIEHTRDKQQFALFFIDLDGFKLINDTHGHKAGDLVLQAVAKRFKDTLRNADIVARIGGDEFAVILRNIKNKKHIAKVANKIIKAIEKPIHLDEITCSVGSSIGISLFPKDGIISEELLTAADFAMYKVKQTTKNNYRFFDEC